MLRKEEIQFISEHPFGCMCINGEQFPEVAHFPFMIRNLGSDTVLECHIPKTFSFFNHLKPSSTACRLIFKGVDGFISADDYTFESASTWNFELLELAGNIILQEESETQSHLERFMNYFELEHNTSYTYHELSSDYINKWSRHVQALHFHPTKSNFRQKLSQTLDQESFLSVTQRLLKAKKVQRNELGRRMMDNFGNKGNE